MIQFYFARQHRNDMLSRGCSFTYLVRERPEWRHLSLGQDQGMEPWLTGHRTEVRGFFSSEESNLESTTVEKVVPDAKNPQQLKESEQQDVICELRTWTLLNNANLGQRHTIDCVSFYGLRRHRS